MQVVSPTLFELHAGSSNKRPPEYIYLETGNTLRDIMNACQNFSCDQTEEFIRSAIGCSLVKRSAICLSCKGCLLCLVSVSCSSSTWLLHPTVMFIYLTHYVIGRIPESDTGIAMFLCCSCMDLKKPQDSPSPSPSPSTSAIPIVFSNDRCFY